LCPPSRGGQRRRVGIGAHDANLSHFFRLGSAVRRGGAPQGRRPCTWSTTSCPRCPVRSARNRMQPERERGRARAFGCVWRMRLDGTLAGGGGNGGPTTGGEGDGVWYGKTAIKSCARLDYATAQDMIDGRVGDGKGRPDEALRPKSRRLTGGRTADEVASDARQMHGPQRDEARIPARGGRGNIRAVRAVPDQRLKQPGRGVHAPRQLPPGAAPGNARPQTGAAPPSAPPPRSRGGCRRWLTS
jgi:hypothetical protein